MKVTLSRIAHELAVILFTRIDLVSMDSRILPIKIFANNINFTFFQKLTLSGFDRQKLKLLPVGIELTTDHHWFTSLMLIQLY